MEETTTVVRGPDTRHDSNSRAPEGGRSVPQRNRLGSWERHGVASKARKQREVARYLETTAQK